MSENRVDEYEYNIRGELISAAKNAEGAKVLEYQYQYDDVGNRITSLDLGTNRTYAANNLNQYTSISNSASFASSAAIFTPQFDDEEKDRAVALMRRVEAGVQASMSYCINRAVLIS